MPSALAGSWLQGGAWHACVVRTNGAGSLVWRVALWWLYDGRCIVAFHHHVSSPWKGWAEVAVVCMDERLAGCRAGWRCLKATGGLWQRFGQQPTSFGLEVCGRGWVSSLREIWPADSSQDLAVLGRGWKAWEQHGCWGVELRLSMGGWAKTVGWILDFYQGGGLQACHAD